MDDGFSNLIFHQMVLSHNGTDPGTRIRVSVTRKALRRAQSDLLRQQLAPAQGAQAAGQVLSGGRGAVRMGLH